MPRTVTLTVTLHEPTLKHFGAEEQEVRDILATEVADLAFVTNVKVGTIEEHDTFVSAVPFTVFLPTHDGEDVQVPLEAQEMEPGTYRIETHGDVVTLWDEEDDGCNWILRSKLLSDRLFVNWVAQAD